MHTSRTSGGGTLALGLLLALSGVSAAQDSAALDEGLPLPSRTTRPGRATPAATAAPRTPANALTGFDPLLDGVRFVNWGDYASGGDCFGISLFSIEQFRARRARPGGAAERPRPTGASLTPNDRIQQAIVGNAQVGAIADWNPAIRTNARLPLTDPSVGQRIYDHITRTGEPAVLDFAGPGGAHAVVLYGYRDGRFLVYDPNFPTQTHTIAWDPRGGFGAFSQPGAFYSGASTATMWRPEDIPSTARLNALREACAALDRSCTDRYRTASVSVEREGTAVVVSGTLGPGLTRRPGTDAQGQPLPVDPPARVVVYVNGREVANVPFAGPDANSFRVVVPDSAFGLGGSLVEVAVLNGRGGTEGGLVGLGRTVIPRLPPPSGGSASPPSETRGLARVVQGR